MWTIVVFYAYMSEPTITDSQASSKEGLKPLDTDNWNTLYGRARDVSETAFRCLWGGGFAAPGDDWFSGDAATIYTLVSLDDGQEKLLPLGWGEFSKDVFETNRYPAFQQAPYDIFVVRQFDSYFADKDKQVLMRDDPKRFLQEHALMVARNGAATLLGETADRTEHDFKVVPYRSFMADTRNLILHTRTVSSLKEPIDLDDFAKFVGKLPRTPAELYEVIKRINSYDYMAPTDLHSRDITEQEKQAEREKYYLGLMFGMGVDSFGISVGAENAMQSVAELADLFDQEAKEFRA